MYATFRKQPKVNLNHNLSFIFLISCSPNPNAFQVSKPNRTMQSVLLTEAALPGSAYGKRSMKSTISNFLWK